jgi:hypothetical protein
VVLRGSWGALSSLVRLERSLEALREQPLELLFRPPAEKSSFAKTRALSSWN